MPYGRVEEILAAAFGITAAILAVGGWILIRILRDRQQFRLMQAALDQGISSLPGTAPAWLSSLRQGVTALALGIGLVAAGAVLYRTASAIEQPPAENWPGVMHPAASQASSETMPGRMMPPPPQERMGSGTPGGGPGGPASPDMRQGRLGREGARGFPEPPRRNPAVERWQKVQSQRFTGTIAMITGSIIMLLGLVRIIFAFAEKKFVMQLAAPGGAKA